MSWCQNDWSGKISWVQNFWVWKSLDLYAEAQWVSGIMSGWQNVLSKRLGVEISCRHNVWVSKCPGVEMSENPGREGLLGLDTARGSGVI